MRIPKIIYILVLLGIGFLLLNQDSKVTEPVTATNTVIDVLSVKKVGENTIVLTIRNVGTSKVSERDVNVYTTQVCDPVESFSIYPGETKEVSYYCAELGKVYVEVGKRSFEFTLPP